MDVSIVFVNYKTKDLTIKDIKSHIANVEQIIGADLSFIKSIFDKIGLFDEKFFTYLEETEKIIIKSLYLILYLIDWLFLRNMQSKDMFFYILKEWRI